MLEVLREGHIPEHRWFDLGLQLGLTHNALTAIENDYLHAVRRFQEMLSKWLRKGDATWSKLAIALKNLDEYTAASL